MTLSLPDLLSLLRSATNSADIFGDLPGDQQAALKRRYRELVRIAHPDRNPGLPDDANEACRTLRERYATARRQVDRGIYGATPRITASTRLHQYVGYQQPLAGDLCELFPAEGAGQQVLLKVVRVARNNDLLQAEARALRKIAHALDGQPLRAHFPTLIEQFQVRDSAGAQRHTNVLLAEAGCASLETVLHGYPGGVAPSDAAWMFNRVLAALGVAHGLGIVHGAILPCHVLIRPADHNGMLIDWCYSVPIGYPLKAICPPYAADYPPEAHARQPATPATDLFLAARCMLRLLGGDPGTCELPAHVPKPIQALLRACLLPAPQRRPSDAWQVFEDFQEILRALYGPPRFRPFQMPVQKGT